MMLILFLHFIRSYFLNRLASWTGHETLTPRHILLGRNKMCEGCDFFQEGLCMKCGCLVLSKTLLTTEKCPIGKWGPVWIKSHLTK